MESTDLEIFNSSEFEVNPTSLNSDVIAIRKNDNGYKSEDDDIDLYGIEKMNMHSSTLLSYKYYWKKIF
ncbi:hypothetical protein H5410_022363 [Solanum commersonii]|uniref:Uncharacterized protein n=1 Tax=Solanum commersonii TaxID=4109 RepID=A0A9J5ZEK2_SOLCO|nr:hypothetical protein H5410_022363 [Solanum commersonii]